MTAKYFPQPPRKIESGDIIQVRATVAEIQPDAYMVGGLLTLFFADGTSVIVPVTWGNQ